MISSKIFIALFIVTVALLVHHTEARRGCSSFGHSCFGGHGKRSDPGTGGSTEEINGIDTNFNEDIEALFPIRTPFRNMDPLAIRQWIMSRRAEQRK